MKIVELTGAPGSGKSTFAAAANRSNAIVLFNREWLLRSFKLPVDSRIPACVFYEIIMFYGGARHLRSIRLVRFLNVCYKANASWIRKINVFRSIVHKYAIHEYFSEVQDNRYLLVDEGISHIPFLFAGDLSNIDPQVLMEFPRDHPWIVKLQVSQNLLENRIQMRGHKRVESTKSAVVNFVSQNQECDALQDKLLAGYDRLTILNLTDNPDLDTTVSNLFEEMNYD